MTFSDFSAQESLVFRGNIPKLPFLLWIWIAEGIDIRVYLLPKQPLGVGVFDVKNKDMFEAVQSIVFLVDSLHYLGIVSSSLL